MKLNTKDLLFGTDREEKKPVLLAVTPPRAGERTLLGVENLLQSIAVPEPFSLELAADMDGVTLMARCLDGAVVRGQLSAHYPQARIRRVDEEDDPLRLAEGEEAWGMTLRADGPEYVPLRTFRDDDLLDPGSDPLIALMGALSELNEGERVVARLMLRSLGPDWSQGHLDKAHKRPGMEPREPAYTFQTKPLQMDGDDDGRARPGGAGRAEGLPVGAGRGDMEGRAPGDGHGPGAGRGRLGLVAVEEGQKPRPRPAPHTGEGVPHRLRRRATGDRRPAAGHDAAAGRGASGAGGRRLPPLRQPRRSAVQGGEGEARRSQPRHDEPRRPRPVRRAQRPGSPRGRLPVAPARRRRRDAPGGAVRRKGAQSLRQGREGRRAGGRHHGGQAQAHPIPRRPAEASPPLRRPHPHGQVHADAPRRRPQDAGEGRGQGRRRHRRHRPPRRPGGRAHGARPRLPHRPGAAHRPGRPQGRSRHQPARHPHLLRPRPHRRLGGAGWRRGCGSSGGRGCSPSSNRP